MWKFPLKVTQLLTKLFQSTEDIFHNSLGASAFILMWYQMPPVRENTLFQGQVNVTSNLGQKERLEASSPLYCWKQGQILS